MNTVRTVIISYAGDDEAFVATLSRAAEGLGKVDAVSLSYDAQDRSRFRRADLLVVDLHERCGAVSFNDALAVVTLYARQGIKVAAAVDYLKANELVAMMEAGASSCLDKRQDYYRLSFTIKRILKELPARGAWPEKIVFP